MKKTRPSTPAKAVAADGRQGAYRYGVALLAALTVALVYIALIVSIDNTNVRTTNGLWKSPGVAQWEHQTGYPLDSGGWLYMPVYGRLCRMIPDRLVSYGYHRDFVTYRKMALLNALFGAAATGAVFLLAFRFLNSTVIALVISFGHAFAAFVMVNSLNSEDVIPAYAFFVMATFAFFEHVATGSVLALVISALFVALTTAFHWTLMIPALAAMGVAQLGLMWDDDRKIRTALVFGLTVLAGIRLVVALVEYWAPPLSLKFLSVLYPEKAGPSGWLGFGWNKVTYAVLGIGNYFSGGMNVADYRSGFAAPGWLAVSWLYLLVTLGTTAWAIGRKQGPRYAKILAAYGLAVFAIGEAEHLYSQPQDPQSQIQPMFVGVIGLILILQYLRGRWSPASLRWATGVLALLFMVNAAVNARLVYAQKGYDSQSLRTVEALVGILPPSTTVLVSNGFEGWNTWLYVDTFHGDSGKYLAKNIHLGAAFTNHGGISARGAAEEVRAQIRAAFAAGQKVVAGKLWTESPQEFALSLTSVIGYDVALAFDRELRGAFVTGRSWDTPAGRFIELLPVPPPPK